MSDDCLRAQQTLSEASDKLPVDADELRNAKAHCAACDECLAYVSALAALKKSPPPAAPEGLAERTIAAVREEAERAEAEAEATAALLAAQAVEAESAGEGIDGHENPLEEPAPRIDLSLANWKTWAPWAGAAAVLLVVAGFAVMQGARFIAGTNDASTQYIAPAESGAPPPYEVESSDAKAADDEGVTRTTQQGAEDAKYVEFGGWAYVYVRDGATPSSLVTAGVVLTSLDTEDPSSQHSVYEGSRPYSLLLQDGTSYLEFELVRRSVQGRSHAMTVRTIESFGQWPLPPSGLPMPTRDDGSPVFVQDVLDDQGQLTYVPEDEYPRAGIAIAPGTSSGDPAAGNPNWTWWEPID